MRFDDAPQFPEWVKTALRNAHYVEAFEYPRAGMIAIQVSGTRPDGTLACAVSYINTQLCRYPNAMQAHKETALMALGYELMNGERLR